MTKPFINSHTSRGISPIISSFLPDELELVDKNVFILLNKRFFNYLDIHHPITIISKNQDFRFVH